MVATLEITDRLKRLVRYKASQMVGKAGLTESDQADVEQELWLDLVERWPSYRPSSSQPITFAARLIDHRLATILRHRRAAKRGASLPSASLDRMRRDEGQTVPHGALLDQSVHGRRHGAYTADAIQQLELTADVHVALFQLNGELRQFCRDLLTRPIATIAQQRGVSRTSLYRVLGTVRQEFVAQGLHEYFAEFADTARALRVCNCLDDHRAAQTTNN